MFSKISLRPATLLKRTLWHMWFPMNSVKFLKAPFYRTPLGDCFCVNFYFYFCVYCDSLTHFLPMSHFYTPWKRQKNRDFLTFLRSIEVEHFNEWNKWWLQNWCKIISNVTNKLYQRKGSIHTATFSKYTEI